MSEKEIESLVKEIISDISPDSMLDQLDGDKSLRDQLGLDSMDFLDIVMELRKRHSIEVPQEDYPQLATLNSTVQYLIPKFSKSLAVQ